MKTKLFTLFLVICLIITVSPFQAFAAYDDLQPADGTANSAEPSAEGEFPARFDLRERGVVTPVKQQEPWGICWAFSATAAAEISILTAMDSTYAETGLDLSERHLAWYVASPVTENISESQAGEGLNVLDQEAGPNHIFDFGGKEQCAATLYAQGIGPVPEQDYPYRGAEGKLAYEDLLTNRDIFIERQYEAYMKPFINYSYLYEDEEWKELEEECKTYAVEDYESYLAWYEKHDAYSPYDDWSIDEPDEPGSGKLKGSSYTLTDNNVFNYWALTNYEGKLDASENYDKEPLYAMVCENYYGSDLIYNLYQDSIDQIKTELYEGRGVSVGLTIDDNKLNFDNWALYNNGCEVIPDHVSCIVGWDDDYPASNFIRLENVWDEEKDEYIEKEVTPPGNGAWIVKNSWGSETDFVPDGLVAPDGTTKDANLYDWGIIDDQGKHTGYFYVSYYDSSIGVPESYGFDIRPNNDQQNALQLDYLPASTAEWFPTSESSMWEANVFTLNKDMRINEVATRIRMSDLAPISGFTCKFDLYKLHEGATKPDDGELISTATRIFENQGYHRTALDAPVYLKAGDRLGIVVQQSHMFDNGTTKYCIDAQETIDKETIELSGQAPVYGTPVVNEGESFWKCEGVTNLEEVAVDGWIDLTAPISEKVYRFLRPDLDTIRQDLAEYYVSHAVGTPYSDFYCIDNFCIKAFGEPVTLEHVDAVEPTAEDVGCIEHWLDPQTGQTYADEGGTIPLYQVTVTGGKADKKMAVAEETVTITADTSDNSTFRYWELTDGTTDLKDSKAPETSFKMPAENVEISAVFKKNTSSGSGGTVLPKYNISLPDSLSNGTFESTVDKAKKGEQVTVTVTPDEGYQTASVNVTDKNGNKIEVTDNGNGTYTFTMPGSEITITPTFTEAQEPDDPGEPGESGEPGDDVCPRDDTCPITPFKDTDRNEWYHDGVHWALVKGIMNGMSKTTFEPLTATSRAMIVTMLWRMEGSPQAEGNVSFKDVPDGQWYTDAIRWAASNSIVTGYDEDTFGTNDSVTREQLATILYRSAQAKGQGFTGSWYFPLNFDDAGQVSEWADEAMHWMTMNGVIQGMSEKELSPQGDAVRAQVATMLMRFVTKENSDNQTVPQFLEMTDYQNWAKNEGYPSGLLDAQGVDGINQDYFHTPFNSGNYSSGKIVIGDSRCCQMGIYENRKSRNDFATYAVWGGHYAKESNPPLLTEELTSEVKSCFEEQIRTCGKSVIYLFATVNDYDFTENEKNDGYITETVSVAEHFAAMSYEYEGSTYHPEVIIIGFDGGPAEGKVLGLPTDEFNRYIDDYNQKLRSAVSDSDLLKGNLSSFTTVPEIVGGKASFITDGLHYSDDTLQTVIQYLVNH